jgi:hypothetical protein
MGQGRPKLDGEARWVSSILPLYFSFFFSWPLNSRISSAEDGSGGT